MLLPAAISTPISLLLLVQLVVPSLAVDQSKFKQCHQSGFCRRLRALADSKPSQTPYATATTPVVADDGTVRFDVANSLYPQIKFGLTLAVLKNGAARVKMDEVDGLRQRYNETASWVIQTGGDEPEVPEALSFDLSQSGSTTVSWTDGKSAEVQHSPLKITFRRKGVEEIVLNDRNLLHMEHFRLKHIGQDLVEGEVTGEEQIVLKEEVGSDAAFDAFRSEDGGWEESFGGKQDPKPKGPEALSLDIDFPGYSHVFGIPEHASPLSLKPTRGGDGAYTEPYRLYNLDVFEYEADSSMALYGSVPFLQAHRAGSTVGVFLLSASETWVDVEHHSASTSTHWMVESGTLDLVVFLGPHSPLAQYTALTGRAPLPQYFAIGYHQCRWNYQSETDVLDVQRRFDEADIPLDVLWLDIEYAHEHEYFIWDRRYFPHPEEMQASLAEKGRKLVAIVDPHIKRDPELYIYTEAQELDILSKTPDGKEFEGWCWTGNSAWTDWLHPSSWQWWIGQFTFEKFKGSTKHLFIWNDMNEPSIFNGPEITMQKDAVHYGGWEHRDVHNIGGMIYQNVTSQGLVAREDPPKRPFVLTRAFFAGSQRFGAHWTGDNLGTWRHLAGALPMFLTSGISGLPFVGSDVGGFFGNPSPEMMVRWYQLGSVSPFFRAHGHIDTKRREPYLYSEPYQSYLRNSVRFRFIILPAVYTAFHEASLSGIPIMRPQFLMFPNDTKGFGIDDQFYFGSTGLLIKPVVTEGSTSADVYIADQEPYYHYDRDDVYFGARSGSTRVTVPAGLDSLPALLRGGSILPRRDLVRRASTLMWKDPITLLIGADRTGTIAEGSLYLDDGESYSYERGEFVHRSFTLASDHRAGKKSILLSSRAVTSSAAALSAAYDLENAYAQKIRDVQVDEIVVLGLAQAPTCIKRRAGEATGVEFSWTSGVAGNAARRQGGHGQKASRLVIRHAALDVTADWDLRLELEGPKCAVAAVKEPVSLQSPSCPIGQFQCANKGHVPGCILLSRVNDGLCDPECCDGSDETDGKAHCPNRCAEVGAIERKKADEEARKRRVGSSVRKDYSVFGLKEKRRLEGEITKGKLEIAALEEREAEMKARLTDYEAAEAGEIERKKNSVLFEKIVEMQTAINTLRQHRTNLEAHVTELSSILSELSRDFNPNYQDMAVLGASRAYKDWKATNGVTDAGDEGDSDEQNAPDVALRASSATRPATDDQHEAVDDVTDAQLDDLLAEDPLSLIDMLATRVTKATLLSKVTIFRIEDYLPDAWRAPFNDYKTTLLGVLAKTGIIPAPVSSSQPDRPELARARATHSKAVEDLESARRKVSESEDALRRDWGSDWEWKKLDGTCIEKDTGEYTYIMCFFGESFQKANSNQQKTSLGKFSGWSSSAKQGSVEYYSKHVYDNGQRCWNGPLRSAKVDFVCGTSNSLVSVVEPEKCEYLFTVTTPAVCYPIAAEDGKDEL